MCNNTDEKLKQLGFVAEQKLLARRMVVVKENGKRYALTVNGSKDSVVYQVDGYILKAGRRCDKLMMVRREINPEAWAQIFIELKGRDAEHGMQQLLDTVQNPLFFHHTNTLRKARLVATAYPANRANPVVEKMKREFIKLKIDFRNIKPGQPDVL